MSKSTKTNNQVAKVNEAVKASQLAVSQETTNFISQFAYASTDFSMSKEDKHLKDATTGEVTDLTVYTINAGGKSYALSNEKQAKDINELITLYAFGKASTMAVYAKLAIIEATKGYEAIGVKDISAFAKELLGVEPKTVKRYLSALNAFYYVNVDDSTVVCKSQYLEGVSLTNLVQILGTFNDKADSNIETFENKFILTGKIHPHSTLAVLKKELSDIDKEITESETNRESKESTETKPETDTDAPELDAEMPTEISDNEKAISLLANLHTVSMAILNGQKKKMEQAASLINQLTELLK